MPNKFDPKIFSELTELGALDLDREEIAEYVQNLRKSIKNPVGSDALHMLFFSIDLYSYCEYCTNVLKVPDVDYMSLCQIYKEYPAAPPETYEDDECYFETLGQKKRLTVGDMLMAAADYIYNDKDFTKWDKDPLLKGYEIVEDLLLKPFSCASNNTDDMDLKFDEETEEDYL